MHHMFLNLRSSLVFKLSDIGRAALSIKVAAQWVMLLMSQTQSCLSSACCQESFHDIRFVYSRCIKSKLAALDQVLLDIFACIHTTCCRVVCPTLLSSHINFSTLQSIEHLFHALRSAWQTPTLCRIIYYWPSNTITAAINKCVFHTAKTLPSNNLGRSTQFLIIH